MGRFKPRRRKYSYKDLHRTAASREQQRDELLKVIGGYILEHGEMWVEIDLAEMSKGMKLEVTEEQKDWKKYLLLRLREADGTLYTLENDRETDIHDNGGQSTGARVPGRENNAGGPIQEDESGSNERGSATEPVPTPQVPGEIQHRAEAEGRQEQSED